MRKNKDTTKTKVLGLKKIIKSAISHCAIIKKKEYNTSLASCITKSRQWNDE